MDRPKRDLQSGNTEEFESCANLHTAHRTASIQWNCLQCKKWESWSKGSKVV